MKAHKLIIGLLCLMTIVVVISQPCVWAASAEEGERSKQTLESLRLTLSEFEDLITETMLGMVERKIFIANLQKQCIEQVPLVQSRKFCNDAINQLIDVTQKQKEWCKDILLDTQKLNSEAKTNKSISKEVVQLIKGIAGAQAGAVEPCIKMAQELTDDLMEFKSSYSLLIKEAALDLDEFKWYTSDIPCTTYINGVVRNKTNKDYSYVSIELNLYTDGNILMGNVSEFVNNLEPYSKWQFNIKAFDKCAKEVKFKGLSATPKKFKKGK